MAFVTRTQRHVGPAGSRPYVVNVVSHPPQRRTRRKRNLGECFTVTPICAAASIRLSSAAFGASTSNDFSAQPPGDVLEGWTVDALYWMKNGAVSTSVSSVVHSRRAPFGVTRAPGVGGDGWKPAWRSRECKVSMSSV